MAKLRRNANEINNAYLCRWVVHQAQLSSGHRHTEIWLTKYPTQGIFSDQTSYICRRHKNFRATKHQLLVADTKICEWQNTIYWLPTQGFINYKASSTGCRHKGFIYYKTSSTDRRHSDYSVTQHHLLIQCHVHFFLLMISLSYSPSHGIKYI